MLMEPSQFDKIGLDEEYISNSNNKNNNKSKHLNIKHSAAKCDMLNLKIIFASIILVILGISVIIMVFSIKELKSEIKDITNKIDIKNKESYISILNDKINKTEIQISEKDKEINSIKKNLQQKDEETKTINQSINNINTLMADNINNIQSELKEKDKEMEKHSNNFNILNDKINNIDIRINKNSDEIQEIKDIESNLALLVDFKIKVRIRALFFIDDQQLQLCSHKPFDSDIIDEYSVRLNVFKYGFAGCVWILHQNGKFFEFALTDSTYGMNNWKIQIKNNNVFCTDTTMGSIFILEEGKLNKYYKIKNTETRQYLFINQDKKRDDLSYYIDLTINKELATDFYFEIYHEQ